MKRVLQITGSLKIGGLETVAVNCMKYADTSKYEFDFLVYGELIGEFEEEVKQYGCRVIHLLSPQNGYIKFYKNFKKILKEYGPYDIIHSHTYFNSAIPIIIAKKMGVLYCIAHAHSIKRESDNTLKKKVAYLFMRYLLNNYADKFCSCSKEAGEWVFGKVGFAKKGMILPNMIEFEKFTYSTIYRNDIRREFDISLDEFVIGCVGRLSEVKNYHFLLDVFALYRKERGGILMIIGDGELRDDLIAYAEKLQVKNFVKFTGGRRDVFKILSAMDVFVLPSKHEGLGIVLLEAMASGLRCVVNKEAIVEAVTKLEFCNCVDGWNIELWVEEINNIRNQIMGRNEYTIEKILREYSIDEFEKKINILYH